MFKSNLLKFFYVSGMVLFLMSCSSSSTEPGGVLDFDTDFKLKIVAEENINPDDNKVPSPVIVRMYELKTTKAFEQANFIDLYEKDSEILGKSLVTSQLLKPIKPGESSNTNFILSKDTQFVGLYVEFLQYENAKYKLTIPVEKAYLISSSSEVLLSGNTISLLE